MSKPCSQLNSKLIRDTAECHVLSIVQKQCSVVAFKCIWRVKQEEVNRAWRWICEKRDECDAQLFQMSEIAFFFSAISTSKLQIQKKVDDDDVNDAAENLESNEETCVSASQLSRQGKQIFPAITYWAACQTPNGAEVNPLQLQRSLVKCGVEVYMSKASTKKGSHHLNQLCQVLKDHKNPCIMDLVASSYQFCLSILQSELLADSPTSTPNGSSVTENVVRLRTKEGTMKQRLMIAVRKLRSAGLLIDCFGLEDVPTVNETPDVCLTPNKPLSCQLTVLCNDIQLVMKKLHYAVHKGEMYKLNSESVFTYSHLCPMKAFLNSLMGNEAFKDRLVQHIGRLLPILSDPECCLIPQLKIDTNLVEVEDEWLWSFKERKFVHGVIPKSMIGLTSPRAFQAYKHTKEPQPLYFREILTNSLTDEQIKQFCQDFLALFSPKVHKQPVPCAIGASDSGKTSLFAPIFSIVPLHRIARVTKQKSFNKSMIDECTEIIFLDEAHVKLLDVDDWKILCQGGYTSHDSKWKKARGFHCQATMYLTCQTDMDFGGDEHNAAMDRRLNKYYFESLPRVVPEAHQWLRDNAMECIVWASQQVEQDQTATTLPAMVPQVGLTEDEIQNILNVPLTDNDQPSATDADSDHANLEDDDAEDISEDEEITELRQQISTTEPLTLRHRQLQFLLNEKIKAKKMLDEMSRDIRQRRLESRRSILVELGVLSESQANTIIVDSDAPLPTVEIQEKYDMAIEQRKNLEAAERKRKEMQKAKSVYQTAWLLQKEKEMAKLSEDLSQPGISNERRTSLKGFLDITIHKVKMFHEKEGTLSLASALEERKRKCLELNLLDEINLDLVIDVCSPLPARTLQLTTPPHSQPESDEEFHTPKTPSYSPLTNVETANSPYRIPKTPDRQSNSPDEDYSSPTMWGGLAVPSSQVPSSQRKKRKQAKNNSPCAPGQKRMTTYFSK